MIRPRAPRLTGVLAAVLLLAGCTTVTPTWFPPIYIPPPINYQLTVTKAGTGTGTVTAPPTISCGTTCSSSYAQGASVTLTQVPTGNATFGGWSGACTGTGACVVSMTSAKSVTATFNVSGDTTPPPNPGTPTLGTATLGPSSVTWPVTWTASIDQPSNTAVPKYTWSAGFNTTHSADQSGTVTTNALPTPGLTMPYAAAGADPSAYICVTAIDAANNPSGASCGGWNVPTNNNGVLNVAWTNPVTNTDGSVMTGPTALQSIRVYYLQGTGNPCSGSSSITVTGSPVPQSTQLTSLVVGQTYTVVVTAINASSTESGCTAPVSHAAH